MDLSTGVGAKAFLMTWEANTESTNPFLRETSLRASSKSDQEAK